MPLLGTGLAWADEESDELGVIVPGDEAMGIDSGGLDQSDDLNQPDDLERPDDPYDPPPMPSKPSINPMAPTPTLALTTSMRP